LLANSPPNEIIDRLLWDGGARKGVGL